LYKIDRLTRSLADFATIVEILNNKGASFVSVTQQFNTTTSMGRLTLNVLLSFAQFEREVIGERIRDKIAASKKKGMWMGGVPPLGYGVQARKLVIIDSEAEIVCVIFRRYAELGSVRWLKEELEAGGITSKSWTSASGRLRGGNPFSRGALYLILQNRTYLGEIVHKNQSYPANTRRSSISRCGMRFRRSAPSIPRSATPAQQLASRPCSPACCLIATATG
jgi:site-specific DNA recombinase